MGQMQPKEQNPDAPDALVRRMPQEVHGERRHVDIQVHSLTRLSEIRRKEIERKEDIEKKRQKLLTKGQGNLMGLLDDDWIFPGPVVAQMMHQETEKEMHERLHQEERARELHWEKENAQSIQREEQQKISMKLKTLSVKAKPLPEPQAGEEAEAIPEPHVEEEELEELEEEQDIPLPPRPPVPKVEDIPGFEGIIFLAPSDFAKTLAPASEAEQDLPPVPPRQCRPEI